MGRALLGPQEGPAEREPRAAQAEREGQGRPVEPVVQVQQGGQVGRVPLAERAALARQGQPVAQGGQVARVPRAAPPP